MRPVLDPETPCRSRSHELCCGSTGSGTSGPWRDGGSFNSGPPSPSTPYAKATCARTCDHIHSALAIKKPPAEILHAIRHPHRRLGDPPHQSDGPPRRVHGSVRYRAEGGVDRIECAKARRDSRVRSAVGHATAKPSSDFGAQLGRVSHLGDIEIIGHRGYASRAPENTLVSLEAALRAGARAVEFDVHVASCGTPVVIHDETLDRTTDGEGPVLRQTVEQLRTLDAGSGSIQDSPARGSPPWPTPSITSPAERTTSIPR